MAERQPRGSYPKGRARREEILTVAFEVFSEQGYRATSIREIARRVGLTQKGVMHHFGSKEELLMEVLALRDNLSAQQLVENGDAFTSISSLVHRTTQRPGLVRLFTILSAEATDPDHPAHDYFVRRYEQVAERLAAELTGTGQLDVEPAVAARLLIAVWDGLHLQWLLNEERRMEPAMDAFLQLLTASPPSSPSPPSPAAKPRPMSRPANASSASAPRTKGRVGATAKAATRSR